MLQSIQFIGSGPPTYVYSKNAVGASAEYYHVFATETRGYDKRREKRYGNSAAGEKEKIKENQEEMEFKVTTSSEENLQEIYQKEYGRRESFLWKQR